jgi:hypothetical protein
MVRGDRALTQPKGDETVKVRTSIFVIVIACIFAIPSSTYAQPAAASRGIASGELAGSRLTFSWGAVPTATWYRLWINDGTGNKLDAWYPAAQVGCDTRPLCSVGLTVTLQPGDVTWWVQTYSPFGFGPWSEAHKTAIAAAAPPSMGLYDVTGTRVGTVLDVGSTTQVSALISVGGRLMPFYVDRAGVVGGVGTLADLYFATYDCSGGTFVRTPTGPKVSLFPAAVVTQPGSVVWAAIDGAQPEIAWVFTRWRNPDSEYPHGVCEWIADFNGANYPNMYKAARVGSLQGIAPFSVR